MQPWDAAAGLLLVAEAGGVSGDLDGRVAGAVPASGHVLAATPDVYDELAALLRDVFSPDGDQ
ncbi:MAG: hypothetical protein M3P93_10185 [Actinomycetota bacterium]|nr:hypothetical protein [Actinomycetota bacterium]